MESLKMEMVNLVASGKITFEDYLKVNKQIEAHNTILAIIEYLKIRKKTIKIKW